MSERLERTPNGFESLSNHWEDSWGGLMAVGKSNRPRFVRLSGVMRWHALAWERSAFGQRTLVLSSRKSTVKPP